MELENEKPNVYEKLSSRPLTAADEDEDVVDPFDEREVFGKQSGCARKQIANCSNHATHHNRTQI